MIDRVKQIMSYYNMSVNAFALKIGSNQVTINQQINGDRKISLDTILKIANSFELLSTNWLLTGKGSMFNEESTSNIDSDLILTNKNLSETVMCLSRTIENLTNK